MDMWFHLYAVNTHDCGSWWLMLETIFKIMVIFTFSSLLTASFLMLV